MTSLNNTHADEDLAHNLHSTLEKRHTGVQIVLIVPLIYLSLVAQMSFLYSFSSSDTWKLLSLYQNQGSSPWQNPVQFSRQLAVWGSKFYSPCFVQCIGFTRYKFFVPPMAKPKQLPCCIIYFILFLICSAASQTSPVLPTFLCFILTILQNYWVIFTVTLHPGQPNELQTYRLTFFTAESLPMALLGFSKGPSQLEIHRQLCQMTCYPVYYPCLGTCKNTKKTKHLVLGFMQFWKRACHA